MNLLRIKTKQSKLPSSSLIPFFSLSCGTVERYINSLVISNNNNTCFNTELLYKMLEYSLYHKCDFLL